MQQRWDNDNQPQWELFGHEETFGVGATHQLYTQKNGWRSAGFPRSIGNNIAKRILRTARLVGYRKQGRNVRYSFKDHHIFNRDREVSEHLNEPEAF
ncbi:MAG: hypothetical protein AAGA60_28505 [Cyanobacteria bacterium P01_E01_bin.42]